MPDARASRKRQIQRTPDCAPASAAKDPITLWIMFGVCQAVRMDNAGVKIGVAAVLPVISMGYGSEGRRRPALEVNLNIVGIKQWPGRLPRRPKAPRVVVRES
jgi:hypothetical protein